MADAQLVQQAVGFLADGGAALVLSKRCLLPARLRGVLACILPARLVRTNDGRELVEQRRDVLVGSIVARLRAEAEIVVNDEVVGPIDS